MTRKRKALPLFGLVLAVSLLVAFIPKTNIGIGSVSATQWTGLGSPWGVAIGDYDNDGLNDLALTEYEGSNIAVTV